MRAAWSTLAFVVIGCGSDPMLRPIIDTPPASSAGFPYVGIDEVSLAVAEAGDEGNLRVADFQLGDAPRLTNVPFGRDLVVHMSARIAGSISAYGRTCAFDYEAGGQPNDPHLYLARVGRFAEAELGLSASPRGVFAWAMPDGGAGFVGGGIRLARYDVGTAVYEEIDTRLDRDRAAYVPLEDGRLLVIGGEDPEGGAVGEITAIDLRAVPGPDAPLDSTSMQAMSSAFGAALTDGSAIVAGGESGGLSLGTAHRVEITNAGIVTESIMPGLAYPRADAVMTRLGDGPAADVLVTGGIDTSMALAVPEVEIYRPLPRKFVTVPGAVLAAARWGHKAVPLPDSSVLVIGGYTAPGVTTPLIELFERSTNEFRTLGDLDARAGRVDMTVTALPDGRILIAGGLDADGAPTSAAFIARQDLQSGTFSLLETDPMAAPRSGHEAVLLCDGTVLIVGGTDDDGAPIAERYNPPPDGRR